MFFPWDGTTKLFIRAAVSCIDAIITNHFEIRFRDVPYKSFHEIQYGNGFINKFVVLVSVVVKSNRITIVLVNAGSSNNRSSKISANVFSDNGRIAEVWFCIDIETVFLITVNRSFDFFERVTDTGMHFVKKCSLKRFPEKLIIKVFEGTPTT